ncbi:MAG: pseudouridine synthase [Clostridia bacterium]|nr:rRNA pseudouridine synthase [Clostridia bacterium]MDH7572360.1 pseudouridine synthase [Clostridia bacterium]
MGAHRRLAKALADLGVASRRRAEELIRAGRVRVNGVTVTDPARGVGEGDVLEVDGRRLRPAPERVALLLYKPAGYLSTVTDPFGRPTVLDLVGPQPYRLYPVGRLDLDAEGLLLLTNDGELAFLLTHPRHEVEKTYRVLVKGRPGPGALEQLRQGVRLEDGRTSPARVRQVGRRGSDTWLEITVHEGRKRQIKRMCRAVGHPVLSLTRTRLGFLTLKGLAPGRYRRLTAEEIGRLKALARGQGKELPT